MGFGILRKHVLINGTFEGATRVETEHSSSEKFRVPQLGYPSSEDNLPRHPQSQR
jgi:hypothetical protein